ncbi:DASH family cryptochrome [Thalassotalea euphylliae]|uniref:DASH family cryptochrome n=1 Tax=Thalassotalea euphylliae TaxID=1655234 RepID=UPI00363CF05A
MNTGLFLFTSDLRVQDNRALFAAASYCQRLLLVYVIDPNEQKKQQYQCAKTGEHRQLFIQQALHDLSEQLLTLDQHLIVQVGEKAHVLNALIREHNVDVVYYSSASDSQSQQQLLQLQQKIPMVSWNGIWQHTLYERHQLPFTLDDLPASFSAFRRKLEKNLPAIAPPQQLASLPPSPIDSEQFEQVAGCFSGESLFDGGSRPGAMHLDAYFQSDLAQHYKETRNAIDDWAASTKFSPWIANGCLSVRQIYSALRNHEITHGSNESTYWIFFELLWREYFHWLALKIGDALFNFTGTRDKKPLTSFHGERFVKWQQGATPYPLVNAIMHQLRDTGFISNRARQITASCLVNELCLDWRYGAAYFQQQLVDYDPAANWGNWQYIAGVGVDPRGGRHFNIEKQQQMFDADGEYVKRWQGEQSTHPIDSVDIADWPIAQ